MNSIRFHALLIGALALLVASITSAEDRSPLLLNALEVRQLIARGEPADNARLSAHFTALADRYEAEARQHLAMAQSFGGNPGRGFGAGMSTHCKRLADLNGQSATTLRELASYHQKLAAGVSSTPPTNAGRFQDGAAAPAPTEQELKLLAAKAATPADHRTLEEYFRTAARRYMADASEHTTMAQTYRARRSPSRPRTATA